jgi:choline monooxygenase
MRLRLPPPAALPCDADLRQARTPPGDFYRDPAWFVWQREALFAPSWHLAPALGRVTLRGQVEPFTLLPSCLDEPLLGLHDGDALRCLPNVCTHRGMELVAAPGVRKSLRCGYHGRRFGLDGRCLGAPGFDDLPCREVSADDLQPLGVARWSTLPFVSLGPGDDFAAWLGGAATRLAMLPMDKLLYDPSGQRSFTVRAHWALYVENYLEGLHVPFVHPGLQRALAMEGYRTELLEGPVLQVGAARNDDTALMPMDPARPDDRVAAYYLWLFPGTMLNFYPWGLSANVVVPEAVDRTRVDYLRWVWAPSLLGTGAGGALNAVEQEDDAVVEAVQRGVGSRRFGGGRYAPDWEAGVHAFHRQVALRSGTD